MILFSATLVVDPYQKATDIESRYLREVLKLECYMYDDLSEKVHPCVGTP